MNTLLNNLSFIQNILVIHQQMRDNNFDGTLQLNENYLTLRDSNQEITYNLNDGTQLSSTLNLDLLVEPVGETLVQVNELTNNNRVDRLVEIINTEVSNTAITANIQYQFRPEQNWKTRIETVFNDLFENRDNQTDESQYIRYYHFGQLLSETPRQYSRKTYAIQRDLARSKGITSIKRYYILARRVYRLLQKCGLQKAYNFQRITYYDLVHLREEEIKEILRRI